MPRSLEIILATIGLLLLSPVLIVLALIIKLDDGGPVFYRARRIGRDGHEFALLKFRSMIAGADKRGDGLTTMNDSRVTPMGSFLRRRKLDELPQLFNVLVGDMSFVGPRPEDPRYVEIYTAEQRRVLSTRPGITSPASIEFRNEETLLGWEFPPAHGSMTSRGKRSTWMRYFPRNWPLSLHTFLKGQHGRISGS